MTIAVSVPSLAAYDVLLRVALAAALGATIGLEREFREREAGLRTHLLVAAGSALFTIVSAYGFRDFILAGGNVVRTDPTRIAAQVVSGIGFLGAGAIIRQGLSVRGLTTAATLWVVAAIGMASGAGYYSAAAVTTALTLVGLWPLRILAFRVFTLLRPGRQRLVVDLEPGTGAGGVLSALETAGAHVDSLELADEQGRRSVLLELELPNQRRGAALAAVTELDRVLGVRWSQ